MVPTWLQPRGLLGLFGVKTGGRVPQLALEELRPVFDLLDFYLADDANATNATATTGALVAGINLLFAGPPSGRAWLVTDLSAFVNVGAVAASVGAQLVKSRANVGAVTPYEALNDPMTLFVNTQGYFSRRERKAFWLTPGSAIHLELLAAPGAAVTATGFMRYFDVPI